MGGTGLRTRRLWIGVAAVAIGTSAAATSQAAPPRGMEPKVVAPSSVPHLDLSGLGRDFRIIEVPVPAIAGVSYTITPRKPARGEPPVTIRAFVQEPMTPIVPVKPIAGLRALFGGEPAEPAEPAEPVRITPDERVGLAKRLVERTLAKGEKYGAEIVSKKIPDLESVPVGDAYDFAVDFRMPAGKNGLTEEKMVQVDGRVVYGHTWAELTLETGTPEQRAKYRPILRSIVIKSDKPDKPDKPAEDSDEGPSE